MKSTPPAHPSSPYSIDRHHARPSSESARHPAAPLRVLMVEDSPDDVALFEASVRRLAAPMPRIVHERRLCEALERLQEEPFDVLLLDLNLPDTNGIDTVRRVLDVDDEIPIVVLSGQDDAEFALEVVKAGAQDYLVKWQDDGHGMLRSLRYAIERKRADHQLRFLTEFDALTSLPNRAQLMTQLRKACHRAARTSSAGALLFIDLDRFKLVNDTQGHAAGDELLKTIGERLMHCIRRGDTVARMGGDEFAIVAEGLDDEHDAAAIATKVLDLLAEPLTLDDRSIRIGASIGITMYPVDSSRPEVLLKNADIALYTAKAAGGKTCRFFTEQMQHQVTERHRLETDLRAAMHARDFELHYQPRFDLVTQRVIGLEALLRWNHPARGNVSPADFIPVAEECGLINAIGEQVIEMACLQIACWRAKHGVNVPVSVNVSPCQLAQPDFAEQVERILEQTSLDASNLEIEITETVLLQHVETCLRNLARLKSLGMRIYLDDFGTGYSSLNHIQRFPIDALKIDRSFVQILETEEGSAPRMLRAILLLARELEIDVVAEGIETQAQLELLRGWGCLEGQGFLLARPRAAGDLTELLDYDYRARA